jgi:hypothetical protein
LQEASCCKIDGDHEIDREPTFEVEDKIVENREIAGEESDEV